jgi:hypothetical protein
MISRVTLKTPISVTLLAHGTGVFVVTCSVSRVGSAAAAVAGTAERGDERNGD